MPFCLLPSMIYSLTEPPPEAGIHVHRPRSCHAGIRRRMSRPAKPDPKGAKRACRRACGSRSRVFETYGWRQQRCEPIQASRAKRPEGFSLDRAADSGTTAGVTDGQAEKEPFLCQSFFFLFLAGNALQKSGDFGCSPRGSAGADFDGFGEASALAPRPPCAFC
jgi:hypothetical protein